MPTKDQQKTFFDEVVSFGNGNTGASEMYDAFVAWRARRATGPVDEKEVIEGIAKHTGVSDGYPKRGYDRKAGMFWGIGLCKRRALPGWPGWM